MGQLAWFREGRQPGPGAFSFLPGGPKMLAVSVAVIRRFLFTESLLRTGAVLGYVLWSFPNIQPCQVEIIISTCYRREN